MKTKKLNELSFSDLFLLLKEVNNNFNLVKDGVRTVCGNSRPTPAETSSMKSLKNQMEKLDEIIVQKAKEYEIDINY